MMCSFVMGARSAPIQTLLIHLDGVKNSSHCTFRVNFLLNFILRTVTGILLQSC